ncbi:C2 domain containing protein [Novymonas esmeraldas]|uniref:C2 domain containing protein n=1 Tax=Novymonas esmeraldas TaxID=1808958 RepID=A0AAW0ESW5_9TRYP
MARVAVGDSLNALKGQLSEKEFRIGELENRVRDLFNEAKELDEKLRVANRNARVLEEENSNYHIRLKSAGRESDTPERFPMQKEAMSLIHENEELRLALAKADERVREISDRTRDSDHGVDRQIRDLQSECERMRRERLREVKELENTRYQCAEVQRRLDDEEETLKAAKELWEQERERYQQKIDELLDFNRRAERPYAARASKIKDGSVGEPLEHVLLKEEVAQLEEKLKATQQKCWEKEKEWVRIEAELRRGISEAQSNGGSESRNDKALFQAMKEQVKALQDEIQALRGDRRSARAAQSATTGTGIPFRAELLPHENAAAKEWAARCESAEKLNDKLRDQADAAKAKILELQSAVDEKAIACREAEVRLAAAQKQIASASRSGATGRPASVHSMSERSYGSRMPGASQSHEDGRVVALLRQRIRDLESEVKRLDSMHDQKEAISNVRIKEYESQIEELLQENAGLQDARRALGHGASEESAMDSLDGVLRLTKDKRESVEEVMRLLEFAWDSDDEAKRHLRRAKYQGAAMAGHDAAKDDEIHRLQKYVSDLEAKLRDMEGKLHDVEKQADNTEELKDAVGDLRKQNRSLGGENDRLRRKIEELERSKEDLAHQQSGRQNDARRRAEELQTEVDELRRKLASTRRTGSQPVSPRPSANASASAVPPQASARSPRPNPRHRTPEAPALSQLSIRSADEQRRNAVPEGAHLAFTVVELTDVLRNGRPITEPGHVIIKLKSIKEKYKTSVKELSSVIRFDETFVFYLAQPDQDVITLHVFYKSHGNSREFHIGDACFSMATLHRGVARQRIAPVVQSPGTKEGRRAAQVEVHLQTDDFGKTMEPSEDEVEEETMRFNELVHKFESSAPEKLHAADVYMASSELQ